MITQMTTKHTAKCHKYKYGKMLPILRYTDMRMLIASNVNAEI